MLDLGHVRCRQSAIVLGAGSIGLMLVQWLQILGARLIVATDVVPANRPRQPWALGAHVTLDPTVDDVPAEVGD